MKNRVVDLPSFRYLQKIHQSDLIIKEVEEEE